MEEEGGYTAGRCSLEIIAGGPYGAIWPLGDIWRRLEIFLVVTSRGGERATLASNGQKPEPG